MVEVLEFIFSSFWVYLGSLVMLTVLVAGMSSLFTISVIHKHEYNLHEDEADGASDS